MNFKLAFLKTVLKMSKRPVGKGGIGRGDRVLIKPCLV